MSRNSPEQVLTRRGFLKAILGGAGALAASQIPDAGGVITTAADILSSNKPITRRNLLGFFRPKSAEAATGSSSATESTQTTNTEVNAQTASRGLSQGELRVLTEEQYFADPAFEKLWHKNGLGDRVWGPYQEGNPPVKRTVAYSETYDQSPGGIRLVQYFDKSRMEINNPNGDPNSEWFVTNGLLVWELITGQMQVADARFEPRKAANVIIAGNENANGPTYATFADFLGRVEKRVGEDIIETITRDGVVSTNEGVRGYGVKNGQYIEDTGHHVATVFENEWNVYTDGLPLTEGKWVWTTVGAKDQWVFVQPFQRRTKTFTPQNPEGWKIEEGNVGRHYHQWRYGISIEQAAREGIGGQYERHTWNNGEIRIYPKSLLALRPKPDGGQAGLDQMKKLFPDAPRTQFYMIGSEEKASVAAQLNIDPSEFGSFTIPSRKTGQQIPMGSWYMRTVENEEGTTPIRDGLLVLCYDSADKINELNDWEWLHVNNVWILMDSTLDANQNPENYNKLTTILQNSTTLSRNK